MYALKRSTFPCVSQEDFPNNEMDRSKNIRMESGTL